MDENTWRFAQLFMWLIGVQTTVIIAMFGAMWIYMIKRFSELEAKFEAKFDKIEVKFDKIDNRLLDIEKRVGQIEGAMMTKECCMLKGDSQLRKAE